MAKSTIPFWAALVIAVIGAGVAAFAMLAIDVIFQQWLLDNLVNAYAGDADFGMIILFLGFLIAGMVAIVTSLVVARYVAEVRESGGKMWGLSILAFSLNLVTWIIASYLVAGTMTEYTIPLARAMTYLVVVFPGGINLYWASVAGIQMFIFALLLLLFAVQVKAPSTGKRVGYTSIQKHKKTNQRKNANSLSNKVLISVLELVGFLLAWWGLWSLMDLYGMSSNVLAIIGFIVIGVIIIFLTVWLNHENGRK